MQIQPILLSVAGLSLTLSGFAGLTVAIQHRGLQDWPEHARIRLQTLIESGLFVVALALFPVGLYALGVTEAVLWRWASFVLAMGIVAMAIRIAVRSWALIASRDMGTLFPPLSAALALAVVAANLWAAVEGVGLPMAPGIYLWGLFGSMVYTGGVFVRLVTVAASPPGERAKRPRASDIQ